MTRSKIAFAFVALALTFAPTLSPAQSSAAPSLAAPRPRRPYRLFPTLDVAVLLAGASLWAGSELSLRELVPVGRCPCDPAMLNDLDMRTAGVSGPNLTVPSNVTLGVLLAMPAVLDAFDVWRSRGSFAEWVEDTVVLGEALVVGGAINTMVKLTFQRPRPGAYGADPADPRFNDPNTYLSFYSLSAAELFTAMVVGSTTYALRHPDGAARWIYLGAAGTLATGFGVSRVLLGKHFPTDVIAAAAVGTLIGIVVPMLHERPIPVTLGAAVMPGAATINATVTLP